jgi:5,10-methylenetetrahydromethanopterin reductase
VLERAGDTAGAVGIAVGAVTVVDEDGDAARRLARREVALYLPVVAALDPTVQVEPERLARIRSAAEKYDFQAAAALIDDALLARFAFAGTPDEVAEHARAVLDAGAQRVEFGTPHGLTPRDGLRLLGTQVLRAVNG